MMGDADFDDAVRTIIFFIVIPAFIYLAVTLGNDLTSELVEFFNDFVSAEVQAARATEESIKLLQVGVLPRS